ncbi:prephenate dehydratase [Actinomyces vulturis]|uniref:prephenate dehydratase n=1 Tax=Actinomyces vulturis TaxID=1857645 RepID=UPI0008343A3E|nr:prephenate dehydratase [Actinomyces vulturis]
MSEKTLRIAYQGEEASNSHYVCTRLYPEATYVPCVSFADVFFAVNNGDADMAVIPIDNSLAGRVADIHQLLPGSGMHIISEYFHPITFDLMALPGVCIDEITDVRSHVHALGQCQNLITSRHLRSHVCADTAGAAREVAQMGAPTMAAIAPPAAAELYGLNVLEKSVEDSSANTTRFVVLSPTQSWVDDDHPDPVTTFVFKVRNIPSALYKALGGFATNGVNMTKLESYMVEGAFASTQFLAEIDGHPHDAAVARALEELDFFSDYVHILGVYGAHPVRRQ